MFSASALDYLQWVPISDLPQMNACAPSECFFAGKAENGELWDWYKKKIRNYYQIPHKNNSPILVGYFFPFYQTYFSIFHLSTFLNKKKVTANKRKLIPKSATAIFLQAVAENK